MDTWLEEVNWPVMLANLHNDTRYKEDVDNTIGSKGVLYDPHPVEGREISVKSQWPYCISGLARIDVSGDILIHAYFMMNKYACILRHSHPTWKEVPMMIQCLARCDRSPLLVIDEDVWLQENTTVMPNVTHIHTGTILVVGSILTHDTTEPYGIWAGTPARLLKSRKSYETYQGGRPPLVSDDEG